MAFSAVFRRYSQVILQVLVHELEVCFSPIHPVEKGLVFASENGFFGFPY